MSEERPAAPVPPPPATMPDLASADSTTKMAAVDVNEAQAATNDETPAMRVPPVAPVVPAGAAEDGIVVRTVKRKSSPSARRRGGLRIPDDEVSRPQAASPEVIAQLREERKPSQPPPPPPPPPAIEAAPNSVVPMRIIQIGTVDTATPLAPPAVADLPPMRPPMAPVQEDSWTPFQPSVADQERTEVRPPANSEDLIPIDSEPPAPASAPPESIEIDEDPTAPPERRAKAPSVPPPVPQSTPVRRLAQTQPEPREVRPVMKTPEPSVAEVGVEDVVSVESMPLPPVRARMPSQPPHPPPAAARPGKPPLVIVPPHVGSVAPAASEMSGLRRKGRLWWEDLFNDDYVRAMERVTDEQIAREVDFIEESLSVEKGGALLDLGCGIGRQAIELARRGYEVVGFDLSLSMLARAGDDAQARDAKLNFVQGDMREMTFEEQFDGVYCWNTTFGYFEEEKNIQVIERVRRALKTGGLVLLDVINRDFLVRQSPSLAWFEGDGCVCMDEMNLDFITSRMRVKRTMMFDDGRSREIDYSMRVYSLHELGKILHDTGFKVCEVSGRLATPGVFFGNESPRTIILAEKR